MLNHGTIDLRALALGITCFFVLQLGACESWREPESTDLSTISTDVGGQDLLAQPAADVRASAYNPETPYRPLAEGMLVRAVAQVQLAGSAVDVRDILVGPNQNTGRAVLESASVFTVLNGSAQLKLYSASGELTGTTPLHTGSSGSIPLGTYFEIENVSTQQFDMRVRLLATR